MDCGTKQFSFWNMMTILHAAMLYAGIDEDPYQQTPESLGLSPELAHEEIRRRVRDLDRSVRMLRSKVHTGEIVSMHRHNDPYGVPEVDRTDVWLDDIVEIAIERGDASEPLNFFISEMGYNPLLTALESGAGKSAVARTSNPKKELVKWLTRLMHQSPTKPRPKAEIKAEAKAVGLETGGTRAFNNAWAMAAMLSGTEAWIKRGRRPKPPQEIITEN